MPILNGETFSSPNWEKLFRQEATTPCSVKLNPMALDSYGKTNTKEMLQNYTLNNYDFQVKCNGTYEDALKHIAFQFKEYVRFGPESMGFSENMNGTTPKENPLEYKFRTADGQRNASNKIVSCFDSYASLCFGCATGGGTFCAATIEEVLIGNARTRFSETEWTTLCDECYEEETENDGGDNGEYDESDNGTSCASFNRQGVNCCPCGACLTGYVEDSTDTSRCIKKAPPKDDSQKIMWGSIIGIVAIALLINR